MKPRPRSVEREVSEFLSGIYQQHGYFPVKRIPILGRTGPDIEINETGLVIDVKSRIAVPQSHFVGKGEIGLFGDYVGVRLEDLGAECYKSRLLRNSLLVISWLDHMDEWTRANVPNGTTVVILHRPKKRISNAMFITKTDDWRKVQELWKQ